MAGYIHVSCKTEAEMIGIKIRRQTSGFFDLFGYRVVHKDRDSQIWLKFTVEEKFDAKYSCAKSD